LSGGIDSAVVAAIAVEALGAQNVLGVSMPGPFSSEGSLTDAKAVAANLGIELKTIPISSVFDSYLAALKPVFGSRKPDVTEENIQARIRGNYLMALSNKFGSMVLSTGNKSELAVGYCTLYGDMAGGLAVISDVPKLMVYELANYINLKERKGRALGSGRLFLRRPRETPSAELRPNQKDEDSLPPYDVLTDPESDIEDLRSLQEIADKYGFELTGARVPW
jgi:NAD+ synthetase